MAKKKEILKEDIISFYMDYVLNHSKNPKTVYAFSKSNDFDESKFYKHFSSFEHLEKSVFEAFFTHTLNLLHKNEDYMSFDARNKTLSFYYTFFEILTANRSYVRYTLEKHKNSLKGLKVLSSLKKHFTDYIITLDIETLDLKNDKLDKIKNKAVEETAWFQLLITMKFWLEDISASFEKTDIFIEKSINTGFDVLDSNQVKSVIDFGKFLFKEKFQMN